MSKKLRPEQIQANSDAKAAIEWWTKEGVYIDPGTIDDACYVKRAELARMAFMAGVKYGREHLEVKAERDAKKEKA